MVVNLSNARANTVKGLTTCFVWLELYQSIPQLCFSSHPSSSIFQSQRLLQSSSHCSSNHTSCLEEVQDTCNLALHHIMKIYNILPRRSTASSQLPPSHLRPSRTYDQPQCYRCTQSHRSSTVERKQPNCGGDETFSVVQASKRSQRAGLCECQIMYIWPDLEPQPPEPNTERLQQQSSIMEQYRQIRQALPSYDSQATIISSEEATSLFRYDYV